MKKKKQIIMLALYILVAASMSFACAAKTAKQDALTCEHHDGETHNCEHAEGSETKIGENVPDGMELRVYEVFGMDCPGCHGGLEKLIEQVSGVEKAEANWEKKKVTIMVRKGTDLKDEDIYDAIKKANFTQGKRLQ